METLNNVYYDFNGVPTWNCYQERELEPPNNGDCNFNTEPTWDWMLILPPRCRCFLAPHFTKKTQCPGSGRGKRGLDHVKPCLACNELAKTEDIDNRTTIKHDPDAYFDDPLQQRPGEILPVLSCKLCSRCGVQFRSVSLDLMRDHIRNGKTGHGRAFEKGVSYEVEEDSTPRESRLLRRDRMVSGRRFGE